MTDATAAAGLPMSGLRVLDFTQGIAGPHATMLLARNGADVVKVEPVNGDWSRTLGTQYGNYSAHAVAFNQGKRSIAVDLKNPDVLKIVRDMAARADIVAESFRPGVMKRFGMGYDDLSADRSDLIYLSVSGFGQTGPYNGLPVTDAVIQAFSGWMHMNRNKDGTPHRSRMVVVDVMTGLYAYQAVATALLQRFRFGPGRYIDCSMMQSAAAFQAAKIMEFHLEHGDPAALYAPVGAFETRDGIINITTMRDDHYTALCEVLGRPDLITDARYATRAARLDNEDALMEELRKEFLKRSAREWSRLLTDANVMNAVVATYEDYLQDAHAKEVGSISWLDQPGVGTMPVPSVPACPGGHAACPDIGEHTCAVLSEAGIAPDGIDRMLGEKIIRAAP